MKKNLFILAACLLPATMCAQSALHQLESLAGMSIHDVPVPAVPDPTPVYADDEQETESPQSTHLKDYTPAQEQETPDEKRKREILEETQRREAEILYGEGRVIILDMYDGTSYVTNPHGSLICHGTNISFPAMCGDVLFIECDGELYASNAPTAASQAILRGDHFDYYRNSIIVTNYYDGKPSYRLCSYGGRKYDYVENTWSRFSADDSYEYIAPFSNDGEYFVLKPYKKDYIIVSYCGGKLYRGKKKYKSLEAAHAGWSKEKQYIWNLHESNPDKCAQNKD